ncbi:MAG: phosphate acyltransferase PlsX [Pseudomonadota bacterium]
MKIAVDAMGGDYAPEVVVQGAIQASREFGTEIILVGDCDAIKPHLETTHDTETLTVHHCREAVLMNEHPLKAVRRKKDASIRVAFELVKNGKADAAVSAGNSGAMMAAGLLLLGRIDGVDRPAFTSILPGDKGEVILLDVGANVDCRPENLFQFGIMAHAFASSCMGMKEPRIGLLNIGEEAGKGNEQVRAAHDLFKKSRLNFVGNIESRDIFAGDVQIVVCDGFVGNVVLKLCEGLAEFIPRVLKREMMRSGAGKAGLWLGRKGLQRLREKMDYAEYGGAPILGINGLGVVSHGRSSARAIKNAIKMSDNFARNHIQDHLNRHMALYQNQTVK